MFRDGHAFQAMIYILASVLLGLLATYFAYAMIKH
jgi:fluoride ion exporter CrcB/FEX